MNVYDMAKSVRVRTKIMEGNYYFLLSFADLLPGAITNLCK